MSIAEDNNYYNQKNKPFARALRNKMTKAEACLWKYVLRAGKMKNYTFHRQRPVLNYIADFMCKELSLVIETDGLTHDFEDVQIKDKRKQNDLETAGYTVLRFTDSEVLNNIEGVYQHIYNWIEDFEKSSV